MKKPQNNKKTWFALHSIVAILYFIVGIVMLIFDWDSKLIVGLKLLVTSIIFGYAIFLVKIKKIKLDYNNDKLTLGFLISVIGASNISSPFFEVLWIMGIILFISGLFLARESEI